MGRRRVKWAHQQAAPPSQPCCCRFSGAKLTTLATGKRKYFSRSWLLFDTYNLVKPKDKSKLDVITEHDHYSVFNLSVSFSAVKWQCWSLEYWRRFLSICLRKHMDSSCFTTFCLLNTIFWVFYLSCVCACVCMHMLCESVLFQSMCPGDWTGWLIRLDHRHLSYWAIFLPTLWFVCLFVCFCSIGKDGL